MARCSWCNTDPVIAAAQYSGTHATWCPRCSEEQLGGPNSAEIEAQMERAQEIFRRLRLRDDNEGPRLLARALAAVAAETREACARVAGPKFPRPCDCTECYCGKLEDAEAVARWDGAAASAAAIRALAPTSPPR